jgi:hypothetical protein
VADVHARALHACDLERAAEQPLDLEVGLGAGVPVDLGADLDRLARRLRPSRARVQDAAAVAQARDACAVEQVRVDARHLRRDVGAHAHHPAGELVHQLESAQIQVVPGAGEQRVHVFEQRRHHQLVAPGREQVQDRAAQRLDARGFRGQDVLDVLGQQPAHER